MKKLVWSQLEASSLLTSAQGAGKYSVHYQRIQGIINITQLESATYNRDLFAKYSETKWQKFMEVTNHFLWDLMPTP